MSRKITGRAGCTVRALAAAAGISIELANEIAVTVGRRKGRRFSSRKIIEGAKAAGHQVRKVRMARRTLAKFLREHPTGRFYLCTKSHAFAVVNGQVSDGSAGTSWVVDAWEFLS